MSLESITHIPENTSQNPTGAQENFPKITITIRTRTIRSFREIWRRITPESKEIDIAQKKFYWNYEKGKNEAPWDRVIFLFCFGCFVSLVCAAILSSYVALICACALALTGFIIYKVKQTREFRPWDLICYENSLRQREIR